MADKNEETSVTCEFCKECYTFSPDEIKALLTGGDK